jgi:ferredoxin
MKLIDVRELDNVLVALRGLGYQTIGPTVREGVIVYDRIESIADLPKGVKDVQNPGSYLLQRNDRPEMFGFVVGPHSWKKFLFPPHLLLFSASRSSKGFVIDDEQTHNGKPPAKYALIGARACELAALAIQDQVFTNSEYPDPSYVGVRENLFIVAVNCLHPGGNCFCGSMKTGPKVRAGFDLALTEVVRDDDHFFMVEIGSGRGDRLLQSVVYRDATPLEEQLVLELLNKAENQLSRVLDTTEVRESLLANLEHPEWDAVAKRCLGCANCTMVCPTCFCSTVEEVTDLSGNHAERWRRWDSCFSVDFSRVASGNFRPSSKSRYRQWLTHKFASWVDQFGISGCVGCGRCITWCPVGIDVTEEVKRITLTTKNKEVEHAH